MAFLELKQVDVSYAQKKDVLKKMTFNIEMGELLALVGPSGCGKTTTLRTIAGLIEPDRGQIILNGQDLCHTKIHERNIGFVFQNYALFPHLTVFNNIAYGLDVRKITKQEIEKRVMEVLEICDLKGLENQYPNHLSGGQKQRVALARAMVLKPQLLLLDEPLSHLDENLRLEMWQAIKNLQKRLGITMLFVSHDLKECFSMADKIAVMHEGNIEQYDTPEKLYAYPQTEFVARFIGYENFFVLEQEQLERYRAKNNQVFNVTHHRSLLKGYGAIRPEEILVSRDGDNTLSGTILSHTFLGTSYRYEIATSLGTLVIHNASMKYQVGEVVSLKLPSDKIVLVP